MFIQGDFLEEYDPTIEDSYRKEVTIDNETEWLDILDTAGQEEYAALRDPYMRNGQGFLLVFSITEQKTFTQLQTFHDQILRVKDREIGQVPMVLVGNKCDLESDRDVQKADGEAKGEEWGNIPYFEASAKMNINVKESFYQLVRRLREDKQRMAQRNKEKNPTKKKKKSCVLL
eukprot:CAMPEP_0117424080 /NCGR_PEP_ID=MMETSP0758-20121206/4571_1 /TAXON_ID=63605 /ORGANISM="Percolomonas cosmopolitus, Strain AE-1 (ATCC 50343)" /LENGTH=173 /DNA_ID=CAMNT_0005207645 /DNA_START=87 /DNA_END=608 /DNA_ORIENTATION=+